MWRFSKTWNKGKADAGAGGPIVVGGEVGTTEPTGYSIELETAAHTREDSADKKGGNKRHPTAA